MTTPVTAPPAPEPANPNLPDAATLARVQGAFNQIQLALADLSMQECVSVCSILCCECIRQSGGTITIREMLTTINATYTEILRRATAIAQTPPTTAPAR
jgi:hypothetical protein